MQSVGKSAIILFVAHLMAVHFTNAKSIARRDTKIDYFDNIVEQLDKLRKMPLFGQSIEPWITQVLNILEQSNQLSDKSLGKVFNSMMPCNFSYKFITCNGTLDIDNAKLLAKKILFFLVPNVMPEKYTSIRSISPQE